MSAGRGGGFGPEARADLDALLARVTADLEGFGARVLDVLVAEYRVTGYGAFRARVELERDGSVFHLYADASPGRTTLTFEEGLSSVEVAVFAALAEELTRTAPIGSKTVSNAELRALAEGLARLDPESLTALTAAVEEERPGERDASSTLLAAVLERGVLFLPATPGAVRAGLSILAALADGAPLGWAARHALG